MRLRFPNNYREIQEIHVRITQKNRIFIFIKNDIISFNGQVYETFGNSKRFRNKPL